jgi:tRNA 2-selenouridine synthase
MLIYLSIEEYLDRFSNVSLVDVRSPGEFAAGHIPGSINIPLFTNEERAVIGTVYKQRSKEQAIELGYEFVNPKRDHLFNQSKAAGDKHGIAVHCWRGGMRSRLFAEHLVQYGLPKVYVITGGYKAYRRAAVRSFEQDLHLATVGGYTGSGKTETLQAIAQLGEQFIDLEHFASHKGSAFGGLGLPGQPTTEHFENMLYYAWRKFDFSKRIWIEDESRTIGSVLLPPALYAQIRNKPVTFLQIPQEERVRFLVSQYGTISPELIQSAVERITKKLGGQFAQEAIQCLRDGDLEAGTRVVLRYYDKLYEKGVRRRDPSLVNELPLLRVDPLENAGQIIEDFENRNSRSTSHAI